MIIKLYHHSCANAELAQELNKERPTNLTQQQSLATMRSFEHDRTCNPSKVAMPIRSRDSKSITLSTSLDDKPPVHATHFGVEFELIFAFKEELLRSVLSQYCPEAELFKSLTDYDHRQILSTTHDDPFPIVACRSRYPSWVLHVPETDLISQKRLDLDMFSAHIKNGKHKLRRLIMEPLIVAKNKLEAEGLGSNVVGWMGCDENDSDKPHESMAFPAEDSEDPAVMLRQPKADYSKWTLTNDYTLLGVLRSQLRKHLNSCQVLEDELAAWDTYGLEIISPIFELQRKGEALAECGRYLDALCGKESSILRSIWCSTHVHIGFNLDSPEDMPVLTLQHLAYILIPHEDLISKCHPRSRSGVPLPKREFDEPEEPDTGGPDDEQDFDYNRGWTPPQPPTEAELEAENENQVLQYEAEYTGMPHEGENVLSNARHFWGRLASHPPELRDRAMKEAIFKQDGTIFDLVDFLQHQHDDEPYRGYMYNFANLVNLARNETSWKPIKPTVEFRQHACILDPIELEHWVVLLEAIMHEAEHNATKAISAEMRGKAYSEREASKCPASTAEAPWPYESMKLFCTEFLGLKEAEGDYWQGRFERYKDDRPGEVAS
ncbi:hypothetical protein H2200_009453 [Cladophialophora chaetospira]|uniref:Uncharacterized protein n=1 Tax=Cladophialophora chaetospira TaxID=386627 RepID=A0AA38X461_9EURO|nr:hypothetical protein H2200_009453 [Cladophialophora chaetospira]